MSRAREERLGLADTVNATEQPSTSICGTTAGTGRDERMGRHLRRRVPAIWDLEEVPVRRSSRPRFVQWVRNYPRTVLTALVGAVVYGILLTVLAWLLTH